MKQNILIIVSLLFLGMSAQAQSLQSVEDSEAKINTIEKLIASLEVEDDHCEVPCGIYGDSLRISLLYEHVATIEKGMNQINEISASDSPNYNQLVRWVMNKEHHAEEIQDIVSQYFLHQRIKLPNAMADGKARGMYTNKLANLHTILVNAMKAKQTTDTVYVENLRKAIHDFEHAYFGDHK